jgi:O6-methylguanine-DNA--protein-cysteine methyltransferase
MDELQTRYSSRGVKGSWRRHGENPSHFSFPVHRVIQSSGVFGQYHWGAARKTAMIGWEAAQKEAFKA